MDDVAAPLSAYRLDDRYRATSGRVFMTGTQALVRIVARSGPARPRRRARTPPASSRAIAARRSAASTWNSGAARSCWTRPASNSCRRSTRISRRPRCSARSRSRPIPTARSRAYSVSGTARAPGVDRAGDALKHGNAYGSSPHGGVLVVAGDDHGCVSSSMPHQSDVAFMAWFMPTLNPASVAEYLAFGEYGYALSRYLRHVDRHEGDFGDGGIGAPRSNSPPPRAFVDPGFRRRRRAGCIIAGSTCPVRISRCGWRPRRTRSLAFADGQSDRPAHLHDPATRPTASSRPARRIST